MMKVSPGDQVVLVPDWVLKTVAKKGRVEDIVNFALMRQWFNQEQLVAMDDFSSDGLSYLWGSDNGIAKPAADSPYRRYTKSLGYTWFFPEESGQSKNGSDADQYAKVQVSTLSDNKAYTAKLVDEYIIDYLKQPPVDKIDLHQSYSVYSGSDKLIVLALGQGVLNPVVYNRKQELRISILRSIVEKLQMYYDPHVVHATDWFGHYLTELDLQK